MEAAKDNRRMVRPGITFRVFVSSTFRDFTMERNALQEKVWPRLRELCMRHGARFQAIDLRWGVSEEAGQDQRAMEICLEEIRRCQQVTPRPNFIVLLGDRYGWRPLPAIIPQDEFHDILDATADADGRALISEWYALDENAIPLEYCLLGRGEMGYDEWGPIEQRLHRVLLDGARAAGLDDAMVKFERSATEQEIIAGALEAGKDRAFGYIRTIEGMPEDERARDFLDLESGLRDPEAKRLMDALKSRLAEHLPEEYRHQITARWDGDGLSEEHLADFCEQVYADLERAILEETEKLEAVDELDQEVLAHAEFGRKRRQHFIGREEIIGQVMDYVDRGGGYPLVIHGRSGSGKSALMAKIADDLEERDVTLITRYIGATPASTQMHSLLHSLCQRIHSEFGFAELEEQRQPPPTDEEGASPSTPYSISDDPEELPKALERFLGFVPKDHTLLIVLDALDQLSPEGNAHSLYWLPWELPDNVRLIASVLEREDDAGRCHQAAAGRLRERPETLIPLPELTIDQAENILDAWLSETNRRLQPEQRGDVLDKLRACPEGHALFLRLAFEEARRWRSFEPLPLGADDEPGLSDTVPGVIADMLARLEAPANHGRMLVERALGYLRAARYGLAEDEMLQVLSADGEVMADFAQRSPTERDKCAAEQLKVLPPVVWSRLYFDLRPYLAERAADGTSLLSFYHRQVGEAVENRYLGDETHRLRSHQKLGEYFGGAVPGVEQPNWVDEKASIPNYRRMSELPWQLTAARDWDTLTGVLTEYGFLDAKLHATGVQSLISDYERADTAPGPGEEEAGSLRLIGGALRLSAHVLAQDADQLSPQLLGRLLDCQEAPITALLGHAHGPEGKPWLRPLKPSLTPPGGALLRTLTGHSDFVKSVAVTPDGRRAVSASDDNTLKLWDLESGEELRTLTGHNGSVTAVAVTPDGCRAVSASSDSTLKLWDLESGEELCTLTGHSDRVRSVAVTPDGRRAISASRDMTLKLWDLESGEALRTLTGHTGGVEAVAVTPDGGRAASGAGDWRGAGEIKVWDLESGAALRTIGRSGRVNTVAVTPDGRRVAVSDGRTLEVWDLESGAAPRYLSGHNGSVTAVAVTPDGHRAVSASSDSTLKLWDLESGAALSIFTGHTSRVEAVALTPDGRRAVSASCDQTLKLWDLESGEPLRTLTGHSDWVRSVAVTPDGRRAVSASYDQTLKLWDLESGEPLRTLTGHSDWVRSVAVTPDGRRAVSASRDHTLKLWDLESGEPLRTLTGHRGGVKGVAATPDGRRAVSVSDGGTLTLRDLESGEPLRTLTGHTSDVSAVVVTPDGRRAVSVSYGGTLTLWDLESGEPLRTLTGQSNLVRSVAVTPDGRCAVFASYETLKLWDLEDGEALRTLYGHMSSVEAVAVTPDGRRAVSGAGDWRGGHEIKVWDLESGAALRTIGHGGECLRTLYGPGCWVKAVAVTPDGRRAVSALWDKTLKLWDLESGEALRTLTGHTGEVEAVAVTPDGRRAVSGAGDWRGGHEIKVWDLESGEALCTLVGHADTVNAVAVTPDGRRAVSVSDDRTLKLWDLQSGARLRTLTGHSDRVLAVAVTPDGRRAVSASSDGTLKLWDLESGEALRTIGHRLSVNAVAVTPDGRRAVSACDDKTLKLWDLDSGEALRTLTGHTSWVEAVAVTPDGRRAVSGSRDNTLKLWDLESGEALRTLTGHGRGVLAVAVTPDGRRAVSASSDGTLKLWDLESGAALRTFTRHTDTVCAVAVTPDGRRAVSASKDHTLKLWDLESGQPLHTRTEHSHGVRSVAATLDGRRAFSVSEDGTLKLWDLESGECLRTLYGPGCRVEAVAGTPDGRRAVSASRGGTLEVWDLESGEALRTLYGHTDTVCAVAVTPDGHRAVSASSDKTLKLWDLESGECLCTLTEHSDRVCAVAVTPDGRRAVSASLDHTIKLWDLESGECLCTWPAENWVLSCAVAPGQFTIVAGDEGGTVHFLRVENVTPGPLIITAWVASGDSTPTFGCLHCRVWSEVSETDLGTERPCPNCGKTVKLNEVVIEADWRPVAAAWQGDT